MLATFLKGATAAGGIEFVGATALTFAGTTSNVTVSLTSLTGGIASAPAAGDLVIIYFGTGSTADRNLVVSGYTEIVELYSNDTFDTNLVVASKFMGGTPDTSITLTGGTLNTSDAGAVVVQVWRGVDQTTPLDVTETTATGINSALCDPPAITPVTNGAVIVSGGAGANNSVFFDSNAGYSSSDLTGFITRTANDTNDVTIGLGYHVWTSGAFDPAQFTFAFSDSTSFSWAAVTLALRPA
jgi:hypothetical protein